MLSHCGRVMQMVLWISFNIASDNGLLPDITKPLPEPILLLGLYTIYTIEFLLKKKIYIIKEFI